MSKRELNSFSGIIEEIPLISVDNFADFTKKAYFLSHCHTDHTHGLFLPEFVESLERRNTNVFMSEASAGIVKYEATDCSIEKYIQPLKLGRTSILLTDENDKEIVLNITLLPAGHCFGSVLFLFNVNNKNILYSGDFRIHPSDISKYAHLHLNGKPIHINSLYVDTTFQSASYENFPKRTESIRYLVDEIRRWIALRPSNRVALHTSAKYGYESIFNEIYKHLGLKVYVDERKWQLYRTFQTLVPGVTDNETLIHLCSNRNEHSAHDRCVTDTQNVRFLYIHLSAMLWNNYEEERPFHEKIGDRLNVCFATHSSRSEIVYFIQYLNPNKVIGFPFPYVTSPTIHVEQAQSLSRKRKVSSNDSEEKFRKVDTKLLQEIFEI